jgi:hypothetical protein
MANYIMKKFTISEEEKSRILNLHENMKIVDKERQLELYGKQLNEIVTPIIRGFVGRALPGLKASSRVLTYLDNFATSSLKRTYSPPITDGKKLLDAFVGGKLSNLTKDDDAATALKIIFSRTDDDELIKNLAEEMVEGDVLFKQGLMNGTMDPGIYGPKQGRAIQDYITSITRSPIDPSNPLNLPYLRNSGNYLNGYGNVPPHVDPDYVEQMLRQMFSMDPRADKWIDDNIGSLQSSIPLNQAQADRIVSKNEKLIDKMLEARGVPKSLWAQFKKDLKKNWALKKVKAFYLSIGVLLIGVGINKVFGITALTPLKLAFDFFGLTEGYQAVLSYLCDNNTPWACDALSGGGSAPSDPGDLPNIK